MARIGLVWVVKSVNKGDNMPINKSLYSSLEKKYGALKAREIYYAMEQDNKPAFRKGLKTAIKEKHTIKKIYKKSK